MDSPIESPSKDDVLKQKTSQFTRRSLWELSLVACLAYLFWAWGGKAVLRTPEFFLGLTIAFFLCGVFLGRWTIILAGIVIAVGTLLALLKPYPENPWKTIAPPTSKHGKGDVTANNPSPPPIS
jgi:hypothetical protein